MKILITNDDGINAKGINILSNCIKECFKQNDVTIKVVAPSTEMSAVSQKLSLREGLTIEKRQDIVDGIESYAAEGTPCDCVKVAYNHLNYIPDIVFSGINNGYNVGNDILYSGTLAAAFEARLYGCKAVAFSCKYNSEIKKDNIVQTLEYIYENKLVEELSILNINIPEEVTGFKITKQGELPFQSTYVKKQDGKYYLEGIMVEKRNNDETTDVFAINDKKVSITYLTTDRTDYILYNKHLNKA